MLLRRKEKPDDDEQLIPHVWNGRATEREEVGRSKSGTARFAEFSKPSARMVELSLQEAQRDLTLRGTVPNKLSADSSTFLWPSTDVRRSALPSAESAGRTRNGGTESAAVAAATPLDPPQAHGTPREARIPNHAGLYSRATVILREMSNNWNKVPRTLSSWLGRLRVRGSAVVGNLRGRMASIGEDRNQGCSMEEKLARIWCDVLRLDEVSIHDNFFDLGGNSLLAIELMARVEQTFDRTLPLAALLVAPTIQDLVKLFSEKGKLEAIPGIVPIQPVGSRPPFFCVGAGPFFRPLAQRLGPDQPFLGLGLGEEDIQNLPARFKLEDIAALLARKMREMQPAGPYFLGGWCMDGVLAYETARQLLAQCETVALLVLFDAQNPNPHASPHTANSKGSEWRRLLRRIRHHHLKNLRRMTMPGRLDYLRERLRTRAILLKHASWEVSYNLRLYATENFKWLPRVFDSMEYVAVRHYRPQRYPGRVLLIQPSPPLEAVSMDPEMGWGDVVAGGLEIYSATGGHQGMFKEPHIGSLADKLSRRLVEALAPSTTTRPAAL
jgi:thioesterase domain-containing protein/acyl carrier protein